MPKKDEKINGEKEIESNRESANEKDNAIRNDSSEVTPSEVEVDETDEQPNNESHQKSKDSSSEVSNVLYKNPDDSGYCESIESVPKLRKRPSNSILENTSKKARNNSNGNNSVQNSIDIKENKNAPKSSGSVEKSIVSPQTQSNAFVFGCKHKREGETRISENVDGRTNSAGRFTKHKGDSKCNHGIPANYTTTCSSDEADVEDNADDSDTTINKNREIPSRKSQVSSSQKELQKKNGDIVKPHNLPVAKDSYKTIAKPTTVSAGAIIKNKKPVDTGSKDCTSGTFQLQKKNADIVKPHNLPTAKDSFKIVAKPVTVSAKAIIKNKKLVDSGSKGCTSGTPSKGKSGTLYQESKKRSDVRGQKKRRCQVCNKKLGLTAISCRCGGLFCSKHRYDKEHNCTFDYKAMGAEEIRKNNPKIVAEKVKKI